MRSLTNGGCTRFRDEEAARIRLGRATHEGATTTPIASRESTNAEAIWSIVTSSRCLSQKELEWTKGQKAKRWRGSLQQRGRVAGECETGDEGTQAGQGAPPRGSSTVRAGAG
ncbi:hypothetical protein ANO11243_086150 [Dothideomycetidae sp. 11243]|nr:hypothetical protein ANO11243_086150 [fungal sp. No.11243]